MRAAFSGDRLSRLLPLKLIRLSIHDRAKQQLRLKFATGRSCYLQLCPPPDTQEDLFACWERVIYLLRPPVESYSNTHAVPADDTICMPVLEEEEEDRASPAADSHEEWGDQVSVRSLHVLSEVSWGSSAAFAGGEGMNAKETSRPDVAPPKPAQPGREAASGAAAGAAAKGRTAGAMSVTGPRAGNSVHTNAAGAGAAATGPTGSKSNVAIAAAFHLPLESVKVAVAGASSKTSEGTSSTAVSAFLCPESSMSLVSYGTSKNPAEISQHSTAEPPVSISVTEGRKTGQQTGSQISQTSAQAGMERERKRREKDGTPGGRRTSRHSKTRDHKKPSDRDVGQQPSGQSSSRHKSNKEDGEQKGHGGSEQTSSNKGMNRMPTAQDSGSSGRSRRSRSTASSGSAGKALSRISFFFRKVKASFTKSSASARGRDGAIVSKTVERSSVEAVLETAEGGQGIIGAGTSEMTETMTFEAR